jgi:hypothetical protein
MTAASRAIPLLVTVCVACGSTPHPTELPSSPGAPDQILIAPNLAVAGSPDLTLTVHGRSFSNGPLVRSAVVWTADGKATALATTFVDVGHLTAIVPAALLAQPGYADVTVQSAGPGDEGSPLTTRRAIFGITLPSAGPLSLTSMSPTSAKAGSPDVELRLTGTGFEQHGHVRTWAVWSAHGVRTGLQSGLVDSGHLTAVVPAALLTTPVDAQVFVESGDIQGDDPFRSKSLTFTVTR